jgi:hypothetical protein
MGRLSTKDGVKRSDDGEPASSCCVAFSTTGHDLIAGEDNGVEMFEVSSRTMKKFILKGIPVVCHAAIAAYSC